EPTAKAKDNPPDASEPAEVHEAPSPERAASYEAAWQLVLESLKKQYNTLYGIIRMAQPEFRPGKVTLTFGYAFHQKRAADAKNKKIIAATLEEVTGEHFSIECRFDKTVTPPA